MTIIGSCTVDFQAQHILFIFLFFEYEYTVLITEKNLPRFVEKIHAKKTSKD